MSFLTLIKHSNQRYPPSTSSFAAEEIGGVKFIKTRYSRDGMRKVFKTELLPLISGKDTLLIYRDFQNSHVVKPAAQKYENN